MVEGLALAFLFLVSYNLILDEQQPGNTLLYYDHKKGLTFSNSLAFDFHTHLNTNQNFEN